MDNGFIGGLIGAGGTFLLALIGYLVFFGRQFEKISKLEEDCESNGKKIGEFDTAIATLQEFKVNTQKFIDDKIYKSKSPLSLTDLGNQLIEESGFNTIFEEEKDNLSGMLGQKHPKNKYDVQEMARSLMDELINYEPFEKIKKYAFETGKDYGQILRAGAIPLRDYYLQQHPDITD